MRLARVPSGGEFTLWLSAANRVPRFGDPCDSTYSCQQGRDVIINEDRWVFGSPAWNGSGASVRDYRHMVVNHETGHWLGFKPRRVPGRERAGQCDAAAVDLDAGLRAERVAVRRGAAVGGGQARRRRRGSGSRWARSTR